MTTSTTPVASSAVTERRMPRSAMVTTGTSGSGMLPTAASSSTGAVRVVVTTSPPGATEPGAASRRAGTPSAPSGRPAARRASASGSRRQGQRRLLDHRRDTRHDRVVERRRQHADARLGRGHRHGVVVEQLCEIRQYGLEGCLHPFVRLIGPVAQPHHPLVCVVVVVGHLFGRLLGHRPKGLVGRVGGRRIELDLVRREPEQPGHLEPEVLALLLDEMDVAPLPLVAEHREVVLGPARPVQLTDVGSRGRAPARAGRGSTLASAMSSSI